MKAVAAMVLIFLSILFGRHILLKLKQLALANIDSLGLH